MTTVTSTLRKIGVTAARKDQESRQSACSKLTVPVFLKRRRVLPVPDAPQKFEPLRWRKAQYSA